MASGDALFGTRARVWQGKGGGLRATKHCVTQEVRFFARLFFLWSVAAVGKMCRQAALALFAHSGWRTRCVCEQPRPAVWGVVEKADWPEVMQRLPTAGGQERHF